jgi:ankyrin repeat protein
MSRESLLAACSEGEVSKVQGLYNSMENDPQKQSFLQDMTEAAAKHGQAEVVAYCLQQGSKITSDIVFSHKSTDVFEALLSAGLNINTTFGNFETALIRGVRSNDKRLVMFLLDHGADPNVGHLGFGKRYGNVATAAVFASVDVMSALLAKGARLEQSGGLQLAARDGRLDMIRYLLAHDADIKEIPDEDPFYFEDTPGWKEELGTALHKAVDGKQAAVVSLLLDSGADATIRDPCGRTVLDRAKGAEGDNREIIHLLKMRGIFE